MATINKRAGQVQAFVINGIDAGGAMQADIQAGYETPLQTPPDGLQVPLYDRLTEYVRGSITSQDWVHLIELLTGTVGTYVCYERKSGVAEASGYIKHTFNKPVVNQTSISLSHRGYGVCRASFECMAADEDKGMTDMWQTADAQAAPSYITAARGLEILTCAHGAASLYHITGVDLNISAQIAKASQDGDVGYTAVDVLLNGIAVGGTLRLQDRGVATGNLVALNMLKAAAANLVLSIKQSQGAANKTLTIANVIFTGLSDSMSAGNAYNEIGLNFVVANNTTTPLTLAGANKIITVA